MIKSRYFFLTIPLWYACGNNLANDDTPVAQVYDKILFRSEVIQFIPPATSQEDSLILTQSYVRSWITKELLLHKAQRNLSDKEKDIRKQVDDYSSSILIHKYKEKLVKQKLEREITETEATQYYDNNKINFILNTPIVKALFIVIPKSAPNLDKARGWFHAHNSKALESLEEYCMTSAKKYDNFQDQWIELRSILNRLPITTATWESTFKDREYIETEDLENYYFLKINDIRQERDIAPLAYVKKEIEILLLNKRKLAFEDSLEKDINDEGIRKNNVKIY